MELWRSELYHHGILGQKWGVRRYQNPDGTRTAAGKKRYSNDDIKNLSDKELDKRLNRARLEKRYNDLSSGKTDSRVKTFGKAATVVSNTGQIINSGGQVSGNKRASQIGNVANQSGKAMQVANNSARVFSKSKRVDLSKMSDADLKKMVDRMDKEKQLSEIEESTKQTGRNRINTILDYAGAITAIGASALTIALAIKQLKG